MEQFNINLGRLGEKIARNYFIKLGYIIVAKNARLSHKEIDLIITKGEELRFIEVKTAYISQKSIFKRPEDYISQHKIETLKQGIDEYSLILAKNKENIHLDLIAISIFSNNMANISYFRNII